MERKELRAAVQDKSRRGEMPYSLGGWARRAEKNHQEKIDGDASAWKPELAAVRATIDLIH